VAVVVEVVLVNTVDELEKLKPEGRDHAYCVALDTPVADIVPVPEAGQNESAGTVPPVGVGTTVSIAESAVAVAKGNGLETKFAAQAAVG
jgi:hypothetical protein